jgi:hypothetical protein
MGNYSIEINTNKPIPEEQTIFKNFMNCFTFSGISCCLPQYLIYESMRLLNAPLGFPNLYIYKQEWYNLFAARGERSLRVTKGADVGWMTNRRQKVRCVNRSQNTGSSRKDQFDLTWKANAKAVVANMWTADPNGLAGLLHRLRKFAWRFGKPFFF